MAQLPEDFLNEKSFRSITATASIAWVTILVIDVVFISGINDPYRQLKWLWGIGFVICLVLASLRLYFKDVTEPGIEETAKASAPKGEKLFVVFNAALIFVYASGFNGFTRELASWSQVKNTLHIADTISPQEGSIFGVLLTWAPNVLANQTAFWPDVKVLTENVLIKERISILEDSLRKIQQEPGLGEIKLSPASESLKDSLNQALEQLDQLEKQNEQLIADNQAWLNAHPENGSNDIRKYKDEIARLNKRISELEKGKDEMGKYSPADCQREKNELETQIGILIDRIKTFNKNQSMWRNVDANLQDRIREQIDAALKNKNFYDVLFLQPIETSVK